MKKQLTVICLIGMLLVVGLIGCLENNKEGNGNITPLSGKVTITTNKSEYGQNETINITLYNGLNVSIYSYMAGSPHEYFIERVEKKTSLGWLVYRPVYSESYAAYMGEVKPGQSFSFEWEPLIWVNGTYSNNYVYNSSKLEPGVYRISSTPVTSDYFGVDPVENNTWQTIYSNEFTIEGKNKFVGTWQLNVQEYSFYSNGTFLYLEYPLCATPPVDDVSKINGTYTIENGQLILIFKNFFDTTVNWIFDYNFSNDNSTLTLTNVENGIIENFTKKIQLQVYRGFSSEPENITVYGVSLPICRSEAVMVFEEIIGHYPKNPYFILETNTSWSIQEGLDYAGGGLHFGVDKQNGTVHIFYGF